MQKKSTSKKKNTKKGFNIKPLADRVVIKPFTEEEAEKKNASGIIIPETVSKEAPAEGRVVAVGPGRFEDGQLVPVDLKIGDIVVFSKYNYDDINIDGVEYYILKEEHILAVL